jgi:hypothetical protein
MERLIDSIKDRIRTGQYQSKSAVREAIVLPLLQALRWAIFDPNCDLREYSLGSKRVDYPFSSSPPKKEIFIEVKAVGQSVGADRQLFEYAFHEGIPFAILTDGREWNFFLPGEQGLYDFLRADCNPHFLERLAPTIRGRTRNHISRSRIDVYPQKPDLTEYTAELIARRRLGTNIANRDKMRIIQKT